MKKRKNAGMSLNRSYRCRLPFLLLRGWFFLQSFVTSGRINRKSRIYLEATTVAQNIMEEIKAKTFEEVSLAFNYPIDSVKNTTRLTFLNSQSARIQSGELGISEVLRSSDKTGSGDYVYSPVSQSRMIWMILR